MFITNIGKLITYRANITRAEPLILEDTSIEIESGRISGILQAKTGRHKKSKVVDCGGMAVLPGFVECHTHTVFGGLRTEDFERRGRGLSYLDILKAGGGINYTVKCTRESSDEALLISAKERIKNFIKYGITTLEIKSGYGLSLEEEIRLLRIIDLVKKDVMIKIVPTFLGAHTYPLEYRENKEMYINSIINEMLPIIVRERLAKFCDVFCEEGAFNTKATERILKAARAYGLLCKLHSDQLSNIGASLLAAKYKCTSADHLDKIDDRSIMALKRAKTTAVLLPYSTLFTGHSEYAPARKMIDAGLRVAISTDFNPGSSYTFNLPFCATLGITQMKMTLNEALMSITINAAYALGLEHRKGSIEVGKDADIVILNTKDYRELFYYPDTQLINTVISKGKIIYQNCN